MNASAQYPVASCQIKPQSGHRTPDTREPGVAGRRLSPAEGVDAYRPVGATVPAARATQSPRPIAAQGAAAPPKDPFFIAQKPHYR